MNRASAGLEYPDDAAVTAGSIDTGDDKLIDDRGAISIPADHAEIERRVRLVQLPEVLADSGLADNMPLLRTYLQHSVDSEALGRHVSIPGCERSLECINGPVRPRGGLQGDR